MRVRTRRSKWLLLVAIVLSITAAGVWFYADWEHQEALNRARYQAWENQREFVAESIACRVNFPSGGARRVTAYADSLRIAGLTPELAASSDDAEGQQWLEIYTAESDSEAQARLQNFPADLNHVLIRQRLWQSYFSGAFIDSVDQLKDRQSVLLEATEGDWRLRISWFRAPSDVVAVLAPEAVDLGEPERIFDRLRSGQWAALHGRDMTNPGLESELENYERTERGAVEYLRHDAKAYSERKARFAREHRHFYLVEAARAVGSRQIVIIRRFGSWIGPGSVERSAQRVLGMIDSFSCLDAEAASG